MPKKVIIIKRPHPHRAARSVDTSKVEKLLEQIKEYGDLGVTILSKVLEGFKKKEAEVPPEGVAAQTPGDVLDYALDSALNTVVELVYAKAQLEWSYEEEDDGAGEEEAASTKPKKK
jgi:histidinol dehydrogenase